MRMTNIDSAFVTMRELDAPGSVSTQERLAAARFIRGRLRSAMTSAERGSCEIGVLRAHAYDDGLPVVTEVLANLDLMAEAVRRYAAIYPEIEWGDVAERCCALHEDLRSEWRP